MPYVVELVDLSLDGLYRRRPLAGVVRSLTRPPPLPSTPPRSRFKSRPFTSSIKKEFRVFASCFCRKSMVTAATARVEPTHRDNARLLVHLNNPRVLFFVSNTHIAVLRRFKRQAPQAAMTGSEVTVALAQRMRRNSR